MTTHNDIIKSEVNVMTSTQINDFIRKNWEMSFKELSIRTGISVKAVKHRYYSMDLPKKGKHEYKTVTEAVEADLKKLHSKKETHDINTKYETLLSEIERLRVERDAIQQLEPVSSYTIPSAKMSDNSSEATAVILASDWHIEETVESNVVNGLNEYNLDIAKARAEAFFRNSVRLIKIYQKDIAIKQCVLALLGDFISGQIHEELAEGNSLRPIDALIYVQNIITSGIEYILDNTDCSLTVPCHSGNHGRSTQKQRHATEAGNSFEYYMYHNLANYFKDNKRIKFLIPTSYLSYVQVYDTVLRFHHGHSIKYGGGIGGLFIPTFKAISQWNKSRWATLDCFGHFHQTKNGGNFLCNGSLIGFNAYAVNIKADFEKPSQTFFLVHNKYGVETVTKVRLD